MKGIYCLIVPQKQNIFLSRISENRTCQVFLYSSFVLELNTWTVEIQGQNAYWIIRICQKNNQVSILKDVVALFSQWIILKFQHAISSVIILTGLVAISVYLITQLLSLSDIIYTDMRLLINSYEMDPVNRHSMDVIQKEVILSRIFSTYVQINWISLQTIVFNILHYCNTECNMVMFIEIVM